MLAQSQNRANQWKVPVQSHLGLIETLSRDRRYDLIVNVPSCTDVLTWPNFSTTFESTKRLAGFSSLAGSQRGFRDRPRVEGANGPDSEEPLTGTAVPDLRHAELWADCTGN